ncbi:MAG: hypothetical protein CVU61_01980 [Deltaproteobacteria bacterium HGW-Deltaproteobacteria-19]|jgi:hypothetical protein|nr:MAG: hypothetical protein CVU61_01980 [Deltaproteobacteria bacterium HGW-Deltaproteobacteria-19]
MSANPMKAGAGVLGCLLGGVSRLAIAGLGIVIHGITVIIAYKFAGLLSAIVSIFFPVLAQAYWVYKIWAISGVFLNWYTIMIIVYLGLWVIFFFACALASSAD